MKEEKAVEIMNGTENVPNVDAVTWLFGTLRLLVRRPEKVRVERTTYADKEIVEISAAQEDLGTIIGKEGERFKELIGLAERITRLHNERPITFSRHISENNE